MKILLLTQWFDPEPTFKGALFARRLSEMGHEVTVLTGFPNYPGGEIYDGFRIRPLQRISIDGIDVIRVPLYPSHDGSGVRRAANYLSFAASATLACLLIPRPDVAYVYHPPATVGLPAIVLEKFRGVPFVYDVQDLWPDTLAATGMLSSPRILKIIGHWMSRVYRSAAEVVVLSDGFKHRIEARDVVSAKVSVIPNWTAEDQINVSGVSLTRAMELGFAGRFNVVFAGTMGAAQALDVVLDAAELLIKEKPDVRFVLIGGGIEVDRLRTEAVRRSLHNVVFLSRRPASEIGEILGLADALLVHLRRDPLFEITIPSKTQSSLLVGKPILMGVQGDAAEIVRRSGAGLVFTPEDPQSLASVVTELAGWTEEERRSAGDAGRTYYWRHMSLDIGSRRFAEIFHRVAVAGRRSDPAARAVDIAASCGALVLLAGPMALVWILVRVKLGQPAVFSQTRPGRYGQPFTMYKFRTMTDARGKEGELLPDAARLTSFGKSLRSTSLDELPELFNVLKGDMALVGPRPLLMRYTPFFTEEERLRLSVRPGITGWAQVHGRNTVSWSERLALDVWYVRHRSLRLNAKIIGKTVAKVFRRDGLVVDPESVMKNLDDERRDSGSSC